MRSYASQFGDRLPGRQVPKSIRIKPELQLHPFRSRRQFHTGKKSPWKVRRTCNGRSLRLSHRYTLQISTHLGWYLVVPASLTPDIHLVVVLRIYRRMRIPINLCSPIINRMIKSLVFDLLTVTCHDLDFDRHNLPPHHRPAMIPQPPPIGILVYPAKAAQVPRYHDLPLRIHRVQSKE